MLPISPNPSLTPPADITQAAHSAWYRALTAEQKAESAVNSTLALEQMITKLLVEVSGARDDIRRYRNETVEVQIEHREYINKLSHAVRELRERMDLGYSGQPRAELPTLPEISLEDTRKMISQVADEAIHRHSDAKDLKIVKGVKKAMREGVFELIKHVAGLVLIGALGWAAHALLGTPAHERRAEPTPIPTPALDGHGQR